ncbi:MAG: DUF456 domain-containing protein [Spirochaetales bacterium]|nr:DUF456 domain-containing protein [Spirochaetales bacterium]
MSSTTAVQQSGLYQKVMVNGESLSGLASRFSTTTAIIKEANPNLGDTSDDTILHYTYVYVPRPIQTQGNSAESSEVVLTTNVLKPIIDQIKPKLCEILYKINEFDKNTASLTIKTNDQQKKDQAELIYTHYNVIWGINVYTFKEAPNDAYVGYKKKIFDDYEPVMNQLGMFFRHMTYVYHLFNITHYFEIKQPDKLRDALNFLNSLLNVVIARIDRLLFYLGHEYQMLNGSAQDWVIYQVLTDIVNASFKPLNEYFSKKGEVSFYTFYGINFFSYDLFKKQKWATFESGVDGEKISDECIFDYSNNYASLNTASKLNDIASKIDNDLKKVLDNASSKFTERFNEAQILFTASLLPNLLKQLDEADKGIEEFLKHNSRAKYLYNDRKAMNWGSVLIYSSMSSPYTPGYTMYYSDMYKDIGPMSTTIPGLGVKINTLRDKAKSSLTRAYNTFKQKNKLDTEINRTIAQATNHFYCYNLALVLFYIAGQTRQNIGNLDSLFVNEEALFDDVRARIDDLITISNLSDIQKAQTELIRIQQLIKPYTTKAEEYIEKGRTAGFWIDIAFIVVLAIAISIAAPYALGALTPLIGATAAGVATFAMEVVAFTVAPELFENANRGTRFFDGSVSKFGLSLASTALMFGAFKAVGRMIQGLIGVGRVSNSVALFFINAGANFLTGVLVTAPIFAFELLRAGKNPLQAGNEWGKFLITHAVLASVFALSNTLTENIQKKIYESAFSKSQSFYRSYLEKQWQKYSPEIQQCHTELKNTLAELQVKYNGQFEPNRAVFDQLKQKYQSAINKPKKLLEIYKLIRRDMVRLEANLAREYGYGDPAPDGELLVIEQSIIQMEAWLADAVYMPNQQYPLAISVHDAIPDSANKGLLAIGPDKSVYLARLRYIFEYAQKIRSQSLNDGEIRIVTSDARREFPDIKSLSIEAQYQIEGITDIAQITVVDVEGRTDMTSFAYDREFPVDESMNELSTIPPQAELAVLLKTRYNNYKKLAISEKIRLIKDGTPLSEVERILYIDMLKKGEIVSEYLFRIQPGTDSGPFEFAPKPIVFVGDLFFMQGAGDVRTSKILVGYPEDDLALKPGDWFVVFKNRPGLTDEANFENIRKAFEEYASWDEINPPVVMVKDSFADKQFKAFKKDYKAYFRKKVFGIEVDKYSKGEMDRVWKELEGIEPSWDKLKIIEKLAKQNGKEKKTDPLWALAELLDKYISVFPVVTGKGYTLTYTKRAGIREYVLKGPTKISNLDEVTKIKVEDVFK